MRQFEFRQADVIWLTKFIVNSEYIFNLTEFFVRRHIDDVMHDITPHVSVFVMCVVHIRFEKLHTYCDSY